MSESIDWTKPVQARAPSRSGEWQSVRIICTDRKCRAGHSIVCLWEFDGEESVYYIRRDGLNGFGLEFRNVPPAPVPFEESRFMNIAVQDGGIIGMDPQAYVSHDLAASYRRPNFVTVPVTIRGEWKPQEDSNDG